MDRLISVVLTMAIVSMAAVLVHREFFARAMPARLEDEQLPPPPPVFEPEWRELLLAGVEIGNRSSKVKIVEFADLQCPYCRRYHATLRKMRREFGDDVSLVFVHYPLPYHAMARPAAIALECAREAGRFERFLEAAYEKQVSLGLKTWRAFAGDAGVTDLGGFERCLADTTHMVAVQRGVEAGRRFRVEGTPTIIVNGWRYRGAPRDSLLRELIEGLLTGKQ